VRDDTVFTPDVIIEGSHNRDVNNKISHIYHGSLVGNGRL